MVGGIRSGGFPRLLVVGRPGSGKTMLADYIQEALQHDATGITVVRFDFSEPDLSASLARFGNELGLELDSADEVDLICAFIRWSGIRQLRPAIQRLTDAGSACVK